MEDQDIVALYEARSEQAIAESARKYGAYCQTIARHILNDAQAAEESVNDTWLGAWNAIPPHRPAVLSTFLGKLTRRIAINRWKQLHAQKRGGTQMALALEELEQCVDPGRQPEEQVQARELAASMERFVQALPQTERRVFLCRYWYLESIEAVGRRFHFSQSKVKSMLYRTRQKLKDHLKKEGF